MSRVLDPSFRYRPSFATDLRRTFARARREMRIAALGAAQEAAAQALDRARSVQPKAAVQARKR
jgi:hypothetical protein